MKIKNLLKSRSTKISSPLFSKDEKDEGVTLIISFIVSDHIQMQGGNIFHIKV